MKIKINQGVVNVIVSTMNTAEQGSGAMMRSGVLPGYSVTGLGGKEHVGHTKFIV